MEHRPKCFLNCLTNTHKEVQRKHAIVWLNGVIQPIYQSIAAGLKSII